jgi:hypothetical protein
VLGVWGLGFHECEYLGVGADKNVWRDPVKDELLGDEIAVKLRDSGFRV